MYSKPLIVYFSLRGETYHLSKLSYQDYGNTEVLALFLEKITGGDLFALKAKIPYSDEYNEVLRRAKNEKEHYLSVPFNKFLISIEQYQDIYLGFPNWFGTLPNIVATFLATYGFTSKTIHPFITHEGGYLGQIEDDLKKYLPNATIKKPFCAYGFEVRKKALAIKRWVLENE